MNKIIKLSLELNKLGYKESSLDIIKLSSLEANNIAIQFKQQFNLLVNYYEKFKHLGHDEIKEAIIKIIPFIKKSNNDSLTLRKQAQLKKIFFDSLKVLPVIGFIYSFIITLFNLKNSFYYFIKIQEDCKLVNLNPVESLIPNKLRLSLRKNFNNIEHINVILDLANNSKMFFDEAISFVFNYMDFVKDIIFLFVDIFSAGFTIFMDVSFSLLFLFLEYLTEGYILNNYDPIIDISLQLIELNNQKLDAPNINEDASSMHTINT